MSPVCILDPHRLSKRSALAAALALAVVAPPGHADDFTATDYPSLVQAINAANAADSRTAPHTLSLTSDITLNGQLPLLLCNVSIDGQGHTLNGSDLYRLFFVGVDNATATLLANQFPDSALGARLTVSLSNLSLVHGNAIGGGTLGSGGGGMGAGGALFVNGAANVTLTNVSFSANQAIGGAGNGAETGGGGGMGGDGGVYGGGGIFGRGGHGGGGLSGDGGNIALTGGGDTTAGGGGGGGYSGNGGDANGSPGGQNGLAIFGLTGGGGNGGGDGSVEGGTGAANGGGGGGGINAGGGGGGGFNGGAGADSDPVNSIFGAGGDGGFGGGGGGSNYGTDGGRGGFGGGGGDGGGADAGACAGGFGGGGGLSGNGGFGGGGGSWGGNGGFGGGGGAEGGTNGTGGFGGGNAGGTGIFSSGSGGGAGMGGAIFVVDGGVLNINGDGSLSGSAVTGGIAGGASVPGATAGQAYGSGIFLQGSSGGLNFTPAQGSTFSIDDAIADEAGSNATASSNQRGISVEGAGRVVITGDHNYTGITYVQSGTLEIDGDLSSSPVTVYGGTLGGSGRIGTLGTEPGVVVPGSSAQPFASLGIVGDATLLGGTTLSLHAAVAPMQNSQLAISGTATLGGNVAVDFGGDTPAVGTYYTVLTAAAIQGTFAALVLPNGVFGQLVYDTGDVQLEITDAAPDSIFVDGFDGRP